MSHEVVDGAGNLIRTIEDKPLARVEAHRPWASEIYRLRATCTNCVTEAILVLEKGIALYKVRPRCPECGTRSWRNAVLFKEAPMPETS